MPTRVNALAVMAKAPIPGEVKTRLTPPLTQEQATEFYRALLLDQLDHLATLDSADLYVAFSPSNAGPLVESLLPAGYGCFPQCDGDLGSRMGGVFAELWRRGHGSSIVIGSDLPPVPLGTLHEGFQHLSTGRQVVLGPSRDGGYYLIGMNHPSPELFSNMTWSHERVLTETTAKLARLGIDFRLLAEWFDIDTSKDMEHLQTIVDAATGASMKRTLAYLEAIREYWQR